MCSLYKQDEHSSLVLQVFFTGRAGVEMPRLDGQSLALTCWCEKEGNLERINSLNESLQSAHTSNEVSMMQQTTRPLLMVLIRSGDGGPITGWHKAMRNQDLSSKRQLDLPMVKRLANKDHCNGEHWPTNGCISSKLLLAVSTPSTRFAKLLTVT